MRQVGKIGRINQKANIKIAEMWEERDIQYCEVCPILFEMGLLKKPCLHASSNAHRHGRIWYRGRPELLYNYKQVVRACIYSHSQLDAKPSLREEVFIKLRGEEDL